MIDSPRGIVVDGTWYTAIDIRRLVDEARLAKRDAAVYRDAARRADLHMRRRTDVLIRMIKERNESL